MTYGPEDIPVITDVVAYIKLKPHIFMGPPPYKRRIVGKMIDDLVRFGANAVSAEGFDAWWLITSQSDWLTIDGVYRAEYWRTTRAAPEVGLNAMRPEVLLTALSSTLFTVANGSVEFIVGNEIGHETLQAKVRSLQAADFRGRAVGFLIEE